MTRIYDTVGAVAGVLVLVAVVVAIIVLRTPGAGSPVPPTGAAGAAATSAAADPASTPIGMVAQAQSCVNVSTMYDRVPPTVAQEARASTLVMIGTVESVELPRWNTADGKAPTGRGTASTVYRNVVLSVKTLVKGSAATTVNLRLPGGRVGCEVFQGEGVPVDIGVGDQFAVFVQDLPALDTEGLRLPTVVDAWTVSPDGLVNTPMDGALSVTALANAAR